jgi:hypothetical protein
VNPSHSFADGAVDPPVYQVHLLKRRQLRLLECSTIHMIGTLRRLLDEGRLGPETHALATNTLADAERNLADIHMLLEAGCYVP